MNTDPVKGVFRMLHEKFHYATLDEVAAKAKKLQAFVPLQEDLSVLYQPMDIGGHRFFSKDPQVCKWWEDMMPDQGAPSYDDKRLGRPCAVAENGPWTGIPSQSYPQTLPRTTNSSPSAPPVRVMKILQ